MRRALWAALVLLASVSAGWADTATDVGTGFTFSNPTGQISGGQVTLDDANLHSSPEANRLSVKDNDVDLTPNPTCANKGTAGEITLLDIDESATDDWVICVGTSLFYDIPDTGSDVIADTQILVGTGAGTGAYVTMSGDATISNTGAVTVADDSHNHTTTTISGLDISDDTNLAVSSPVTLTGDTVGVGDASTIAKGVVQLAGDLGGTATSPSVVDDSHAHTGATISGLDISSDTNLSATSPIVLTGDDLSCPTCNTSAADITDVWGCTSGNCNGLTGASGDSLDAGSADTSKPCKRGLLASLPASCAEGECYHATNGGGADTYICSATNTWTKLMGEGDTAGGDLSGTYPNPSVTDDSHNHTTTTISGLDISADTNLAATAPIVLTNDTLSCNTASGSVSGCLTSTDWTTFNNKLSAEVDGSTTNEINTVAGDSGTATDAVAITAAGGAGIVTSSSSSTDTVTIATASTEAGFLTDGGVTDLTCSTSNQGKLQVLDDGELQWCDGAATSALRRAAFGNSNGESTAAANDSVALGTDSTGNYVATLSCGTGISGCPSAGEAATGTITASLGTAVDTTEITDGTIGYDDVNSTDTLTSAARGANAVWFGTTGLIFEGSTNDGVETLLTAADPTSTDKTITLPAETGTVCTTGSVCTGYQAGPLSGDVVTSGTGATIQADSVALGTDTTGGYAGSATEGGAATTAVALAANGANCSAGQYPLGVDASGAVETCTSDDDTPESGDFGNLTAGAGLSISAGTLSTASGEADFLASGALTCGASTQGKAQVHTTPLQYCDNTATPQLRYAAYGSSTGVATSATALAANGSNCSAGQYPLGVDASGAVESCTADDDVPEVGDFGALTFAQVGAGTNTAALVVGTGGSLGTSGSGTITATTAAALSANPSDCSANQYATTIAANGNLTCSPLSDADLPSGTNTTTWTVDADNNAGTEPANGAGIVIEGGSGDVTLLYDDTANELDVSVPISGSLSGNATTATALASNPTETGCDSATATFATAIDASGNLTCNQVNLANTTGTLGIARLNADYGDFTCNATTCTLDTGPAFTTSTTYTIDSDNGGSEPANGAGVVIEGGSGTNITMTYNSTSNVFEVAGAAGGYSFDGPITWTASDGSRLQSFQDNTSHVAPAASGYTSLYTVGGELYKKDSADPSGTTAGRLLLTSENIIGDIVCGTPSAGQSSCDLQSAVVGANEIAANAVGASELDESMAPTALTGNWQWNDSVGIILGTGSDATLKYDGTDLLINPKAVGTGKMRVGGQVELGNGGLTLSTGTNTLTTVEDAISLSGAGAILHDYHVGNTVTLEDDISAFSSSSIASFTAAPTYTSPSNETRSATLGVLTGFNEVSAVSLNSTNASATLGAYHSFFSQPSVSRSGSSNSVTVTDLRQFYAQGPTIGANTTVTTRTGVLVANASPTGTLTTQIGVDIAALSGASSGAVASNIGLRNASTTVFTPTSTATVAGTAISCNATVKKLSITGTGAITMTANPEVADGVDGQVCILSNVDGTATDCITIVADTLGVQLNATAGNMVLCPDDTLTLMYNGTDWVEVARSKNR